MIEGAESKIRSYGPRIGMLCMLIMGVAVTGGGVRLESFLLPLLAITLLAGFIHPRNGERLGHELQTFLLVLTILTGLYLWNGWGGEIY